MYVQQPAPARACRFYVGELIMSMLALAAALYGVAAANKWSFSVFLTLQGAPCPHFRALLASHKILPQSSCAGQSMVMNGSFCRRTWLLN